MLIVYFLSLTQLWVQCGIQRFLCVSFLVCILRQRQHSSQGTCQVVNSNPCHFCIIIYCISQKRVFNIVCFFVENRFFKESSEEEREHAEKLIKYQVGLLLLNCYCKSWTNNTKSLILTRDKDYMYTISYLEK